MKCVSDATNAMAIQVEVDKTSDVWQVQGKPPSGDRQVCEAILFEKK